MSPPPMRRAHPQVFRSHSQPVISQVPQNDQATVATMQGLVKFVHKTLGEPGNVDPSALAKFLRNDSQASGARSSSPPLGIASRMQSNEHLSAVPSPLMQMSACSSPSLPSYEMTRPIETMTRSAVPLLSLPATPLIGSEEQQSHTMLGSPRLDPTNRRLPAGPQSSRGRGGNSPSAAAAGRGAGEWQMARSGSLPHPPPKEKMQSAPRVPVQSPRSTHWVLPRGGSGVVLQDVHSRGRAVVRQSVSGNSSQKQVVKARPVPNK